MLGKRKLVESSGSIGFPSGQAGDELTFAQMQLLMTYTPVRRRNEGIAPEDRVAFAEASTVLGFMGADDEIVVATGLCRFDGPSGIAFSGWRGHAAITDRRFLAWSFEGRMLITHHAQLLAQDERHLRWFQWTSGVIAPFPLRALASTQVVSPLALTIGVDLGGDAQANRRSLTVLTTLQHLLDDAAAWTRASGVPGASSRAIVSEIPGDDNEGNLDDSWKMVPLSDPGWDPLEWLTGDGTLPSPSQHRSPCASMKEAAMSSNEAIQADDLASLRPYAADIIRSQFTTEQLAFFADHWSQQASPGTRQVALLGYASCTDYWQNGVGRLGESVVRNTLAEALAFCGWTAQSIAVVVDARRAGLATPPIRDAGWSPRTPLTTTPIAGWYPDANSPGSDRYWDGKEWTTHTRPTPTAPATAAGASDLRTASALPLAPDELSDRPETRAALRGLIAATDVCIPRYEGVTRAYSNGVPPDLDRARAGFDAWSAAMNDVAKACEQDFDAAYEAGKFADIVVATMSFDGTPEGMERMRQLLWDEYVEPVKRAVDIQDKRLGVALEAAGRAEDAASSR